MPLPAIHHRRRHNWAAAAVAAALVSATLGAGLARAEAARPAGAPSANAFPGRFPNVVLKTHEGKTVRFYDDLLKDKIVMINFFYADCSER